MDKLAKRAGVAALVAVAAAGSAFALGMARYAGSLETERAEPPSSPSAALRLPPPSPTPAPAVALPQPSEIPEVVVVAKPSAERALRPAPSIKLVAAPVDAAEPAESAPRADDMLDLDFGAHERGAQLADRGANSFEVRQRGGAEEKHRSMIAGQRVTFETDLAGPER